jgi:hypothetical protein
MGKYYDRLVKMNESLDAELHAKGIDVSKFNRVDNTNNASKNGENEVVLEEGDKEDTVEVPADSLTDEQKKEALKSKAKDAGLKDIDDKVLKDISKDPKKAAAIDQVLGAASSNESIDGDVSEEVVIRMDDDDLEMHGFVKSHDGDELDLTEDKSEAERLQHEELGQNVIETICHKFHYDPSTFSTVSVDPRADEPYEDNEVNIDDGETWVSLDPLDSQATTLNA